MTKNLILELEVEGAVHAIFASTVTLRTLLQASPFSRFR